MAVRASAGPIDVNTTHLDGLVPLSHLTIGQSARIRRIVGRPDHVHRLREFGLRDGMLIEMFRPGNPCIIRLGANKVCLRSDDLLDVLVKLAPGPRV